MIYEPMIPAVLLIVGGIIILAGAGLYAFQRLAPRPPDPDLIDQLETERQLILEATKTATEGPTATGTPVPTWTPTPTPTRPPLTLENLRYDLGTKMTLYFHLPDQTVTSREIEVWEWTEEKMAEGIFKPGDDTAITYEDEDRRVVMLAHSGGSSMTLHELQVWLEGRGKFTREEAETRLAEELIGTDVDIVTEHGTYAFMRVAAAVRINPDEVENWQLHVMDIVPYTALLYPESGFKAISKNDNVLILIFCGKALQLEHANPALSKWNQARFVLALTSSWEERYDQD